MTYPPPAQDPYQPGQDPYQYGQQPTSGLPQPYSAQPYSGQPYSANPYAPGPYAPVPYSPGPYGATGFGYDPVTGQPLSDKTKVAAGLLQLLPGFLIGLGGIGRIYAGQIGLGVTQLLLAVLVGWVSFWCGFLLIFPFFIYFGLWLWFTIDGILLLAGRPVDGQGRLLR